MHQLQERVHLVAVSRWGPASHSRGPRAARCATRAGSGATTRATVGLRRRIGGRMSFHWPARAAVPGAVLGAAGDEVALPAVGAVDGSRPCDRLAYHRGALVEPGAQRVDVVAVDARASRWMPRTRSVQTTRSGSVPIQRESRSTASRTDSRSVASVGSAAAPEVELTELLAAGRVDHGEVDPATDPQPRAPRLRGLTRGRGRAASPDGRRTAARTSVPLARAPPVPRAPARPDARRSRLVTGARSSAWMLRTASRNTSRSRARFTGSSERVPPSISSANRRRHMVSARRSR